MAPWTTEKTMAASKSKKSERREGNIFFTFGFFSMATIVAAGLVAAAWAFLYPTSNNTRPVAAANATCEELRLLLGPLIVLPTDPVYTNFSDENWSQTAWLTPTCVALPHNAADVSMIVQVLVANDVPFAVRSGGHSPNPFESNIDTGVLLSLDYLNRTTVDTSQAVASVGTGARWQSVYNELDNYNVTVVGGRVLDVGVGGLTLGSGLSYLTDLYGFACDNVVNYEIVLGDGSIVNASADRNPDLFWALKGGSNNYGVVTQFTINTYPIFNVWGGVIQFNVSQTAEVLQAYYEYQMTPDKDLYANMVFNLAPTNGSIFITLVYLKPVAYPPAYEPFYKVANVGVMVGFMTLTQLMGLFPSASSPRWVWQTSTFVPNAEVFSELASLLTNSTELATIGGVIGGTLVGTVQPISASVALAGEARGGNALGLQAVNQTFFSVNIGWVFADDDDTVHTALQSFFAKLDGVIESAGAEQEYIFMNDANSNQSVIASYGADNVARMQSVQRIYDPDLVFRRLAWGGQKIPAL